MNDFDKLNVLDADGFYVTDFIVGISGDTLPANWTADLVGDGYYKAQYQGGHRNAETGEWTNGHWVETAPATVALFNVRTTFYVLFATRNK